MRIRFLRDLALSPVCSFRCGQVIEVEQVPPEIAPFIDGERAELVPGEPDVAVVGAGRERAVVPRGKKRP